MVDLDQSAVKLRNALEGVQDPKATKRLMVALAYLDGVPVETISSRYGFPQSTVYAWLNRFEEESLENAPLDDSRPGRPPKLDDTQRRRLETTINESTPDEDHDTDEWTPETLKAHVLEVFGVEYSIGHCRRLLRECRSSR